MNTHNSCLILLLTVLLVTVSCAEKSGSKYQDATLIEYQDFVSSQKLTGINFLSDKEVLKVFRFFHCRPKMDVLSQTDSESMLPESMNHNPYSH